MKFNKGLQNLVEKALIPLDYAINMTSLNPARYLGVDHRLGKICAGYDADIVIIDRNYDIVDVYAKGTIVE